VRRAVRGARPDLRPPPHRPRRHGRRRRPRDRRQLRHAGGAGPVRQRGRPAGAAAVRRPGAPGVHGAGHLRPGPGAPRGGAPLRAVRNGLSSEAPDTPAARLLAGLALSLVDIRSVSRHEEAITAWIADRLADAPGVEVRHRQPDALVFGPPGRPHVVLAGHSDTVPEQANLPGRLEGDQVHGLGASDMKGSLAVMLALAGELHRLPRTLNPLFVVFGREEVSIAESVLEG